MEGRVIVCGDFRARCGGLKDLDDDSSMVVSDRKGVDLVKIYKASCWHAEFWSVYCEGRVESMQNSGLCFVNGRKDTDDFTYVSSKGCSVVDYGLVPTGDYNYIDEFNVTTTSKCETTFTILFNIPTNH